MDAAHDARTRKLALLVAAPLAVYLALFLDTVLRGFVAAPFGDGFDILQVEFEAQDRGDPGLYLWHPHNGHHIVWLRLLTAIDVRLFHDTSRAVVAVTLVVLLGAAWLLAREVWRGVADRSHALALAAVAPLALLTSLNAFDVAVPINTPYVFAVAFTVAALVVVEQGAGGWSRLAAVLALAAGAGMGNSVGLAAVPVLMLAIWRRPQRGRLGWFWLLGPLLAVLFVGSAGQMAFRPSAAQPDLAARVLGAVRYPIAFCGLPWTATSQRMAPIGELQAVAQAVGMAIGAALIAVGAWLAARPAGKGTPDRLQRICAGLILFSLTAAAMATLGRGAGGGPVQIPVRYSVILAPLHIGVVVLLAARWPPRRALTAALAILFAAALAQQIVGRGVILRYTARLDAVLSEFASGRRTSEMPQYVHPLMWHAEEVAAQMRRRGIQP